MKISPIYIGEALNLDKIQVYYEDTDPNSAIFGVSGLPSIISSGRHSFFINPTEQFAIEDENQLPIYLRLKKTTTIKLEIIDRIGTRLFYDFPTQQPTIIDKNGVRTLENAAFAYGYIGPNINQYGLAATFTVDTNIEDGTGTIIIVGELDNVPPEWKGTYNVRWKKNIIIQKGAINKSLLYFYKQPTVVIDEFTTPYFSSSLSEPTASSSMTGSYVIGVKFISPQNAE